MQTNQYAENPWSRSPGPENDTRQLCNPIMATETLTLFGRKTINPGLGCWRCVKIAQEVLGVPQSRFHWLRTNICWTQIEFKKRIFEVELSSKTNFLNSIWVQKTIFWTRIEFKNIIFELELSSKKLISFLYQIRGQNLFFWTHFEFKN